MVELTNIAKRVSRSSSPIYLIGNPTPVEVVHGPAVIEYQVDFINKVPVSLEVGDIVTIDSGNILRRANKNDELLGRIVSVSLSGNSYTINMPGSATIQFTKDPDYDYEADRIIKRAW